MKMMKLTLSMVGLTFSSLIPSLAQAFIIGNITAVTLVPIMDPSQFYTIGVDCGTSKEYKYCSLNKVVIYGKDFTDSTQRVIHIKTNSFSKIPDQPICDIYSHDAVFTDVDTKPVYDEIIDQVEPYPGYKCYVSNSSSVVFWKSST